MMFKMLDTIFDFRKNKFFMIFQNFQIAPPAPLWGGSGPIWNAHNKVPQWSIWPSLIKFDWRTWALGGWRTDRQTDTQTSRQATMARSSHPFIQRRRELKIFKVQKIFFGEKFFFSKLLRKTCESSEVIREHFLDFEIFHPRNHGNFKIYLLPQYWSNRIESNFLHNV